MLYTLLSKLFKSDTFEGYYLPKPIHIIIALFVIGIGASILYYDGWALLGWMVIFLGFILGLSISFCLAYEPINRYWENVQQVTSTLLKSNNPAVFEWAYKIFGLKMDVKQQVTIREDKETGQGFFNTHISRPPIPDLNMNQVANKVISQFIVDGNLDFTEDAYGRLIPNFRNFRKQWIKEGKLVPKNKSNKKNGYRLSKKGYDVIYAFASDSIKLKNGE